MRIPIEGPKPHSPLWYSQRRFNPESERPVVFGASIAAAVCGMSEYRTPLYIFRECMGLIEEAEGTKLAERRKRIGLKMEPVIIEEYAIETGNEVDSPLPCYFHPDHQFIGATPDGMVLADGEWNHPLDCKDSGFRMAASYGEEGTDELPDDYLVQAQQQMLVMDCDLQETAVMMDRTLRIYRVEKNTDLQECIVEAATELFERLKNNDPPEPSWEHPSTPKLVKSLFGITESLTIELPEEITIYWQQKKDARRQIGELEKLEDALKARVAFAMQDAAVGLLPGGKQITRSIVNVKESFREAYSYQKMSESKAKGSK